MRAARPVIRRREASEPSPGRSLEGDGNVAPRGMNAAPRGHGIRLTRSSDPLTRPPCLPPPVLPGQRVGVAALSGPVQPERLERGLETLAGWGFEPVLADNLWRRTGLFAGSEDERLEGFHRLAADRSLAAILFARGGYGLHRLLDRIDWELLAGAPRAYVGYSDLTPFLNLVVERLGWVAFHGPMVAAELAADPTAEERDDLLGLLAGELPRSLPAAPWRGGEAAEGIVVGGCLSLITALVGTPFELPLAERVLFWEDIGEPTYRLDRMLNHLRIAGCLDSLRGMIVGASAAVADADEPPELLWTTLAESLGAFAWPAVRGLPSGHARPMRTVPLGAWARLDPAAQLVTFDAPAWSAR